MKTSISNQKISANLWFNTQAEEAVNFYLTVFHHAQKGSVTHYGKEGYEIHGMPEGTVLAIKFLIEGQEFVALNGGPHFQFNEAISFIVNCETQQEVDYYWDKLTAGGDEKAQMCGWLKDKFGVSWQIVPTILSDMLGDPEPAKTNNVMQAVFKMKKLDISKLKEAYKK
ncbi:putative 3-demethylubiquinone-9 3-methyltransferase (glyoxalase superfamily) [Chitinophaga niastensis]|uniref:Putative 3-demethylubiquinone-9 3-methyltransferase (Glyoxalase superfamily) n=1 Tax=Chitinophaga niastensis TaxID=536980 RepID=A0A2P8HD70_CHINA|nr:VOC family protein [Chitinophaga niastensis]PSL44186.1 putative 3-demethylubiquinone-9 3-methyltransferase (glyoxalase superfamily) [Chitinophaga niastensis]